MNVIAQMREEIRAAEALYDRLEDERDRIDCELREVDSRITTLEQAIPLVQLGEDTIKIQTGIGS